MGIQVGEYFDVGHLVLDHLPTLSLDMNQVVPFTDPSQKTMCVSMMSAEIGAHCEVFTHM